MKFFNNLTIFSEVAEDSLDSKIVLDNEEDEDLIFSEIVSDFMDEQDDKDSVEYLDMVPDFLDGGDDEDNLDINLNIHDNGLDINKFPDEEEDSSDENQHKEELKKLRKIYLLKFY
ncbi:unnamed protein product [Lathyrus sativus]|nr:unnamed protein product [Lathyrus sativus]